MDLYSNYTRIGTSVYVPATTSITSLTGLLNHQLTINNYLIKISLGNFELYEPVLDRANDDRAKVDEDKYHLQFQSNTVTLWVRKQNNGNVTITGGAGGAGVTITGGAGGVGVGGAGGSVTFG